MSSPPADRQNARPKKTYATTLLEVGAVRIPATEKTIFGRIVAKTKGSRPIIFLSGPKPK
jgi:hypothetical protein